MKTAMMTLASALVASNRTFAVATVVRREAPSSAHLGDTAVITRDGTLHGFIGGTCTRATVIEQALAAIAAGEPRLISFRDEGRGRADDIVSVPMTCHSGGSVEIYIDPVFPVPQLLLLGSSPVNDALAGLGEAMGLSVRSDGLAGLPDRIEREPGAKLYVLVATMGESDEDTLAAALAARPDYLGVIASRRRMEEIRATLAARGIREREIAAIHGPAGLDIGATRPEEIALSVLAEIVATRNQGPPLSGDERESASESAATEAPAKDPVCGMSVTVSDATPRFEHEERTYYFCCSGCRDRFAAEPAAFAMGAQPQATTTGGNA